jgi:hypothetical protein
MPYLVVAGVVFGVNLLPAFGPPNERYSSSSASTVT